MWLPQSTVKEEMWEVAWLNAMLSPSWNFKQFYFWAWILQWSPWDNGVCVWSEISAGVYPSLLAARYSSFAMSCGHGALMDMWSSESSKWIPGKCVISWLWYLDLKAASAERMHVMFHLLHLLHQMQKVLASKKPPWHPILPYPFLTSSSQPLTLQMLTQNKRGRDGTAHNSFFSDSLLFSEQR